MFIGLPPGKLYEERIRDCCRASSFSTLEKQWGTHGIEDEEEGITLNGKGMQKTLRIIDLRRGKTNRGC